MKERVGTSLFMLLPPIGLFAAIKFYQKCIDNNIKPIIGCQIPLKDRLSKHHLGSVVLLCQNISGYKNLIKLISQIHIQKKPNENPGATIDQLKQYNDHILLLSGGRTGFLGNNLLTENPDKIINSMEELPKAITSLPIESD